MEISTRSGLDALIGKIANLDKIEDLLLAHRIVVQMNLLTQRPMISVDGGPLENMEDGYRAALVEFIKQNLKVGQASDISRYITLLSIKCGYHPVRDYLDKLVWDGKPRIGKWLSEYMQAEDCEYVNTVGKLFLLGAVRRVREPGCKFDECVVLIGGEGIGKSSSIKALVPDRRLFSDSLPLGQDSKHTVENTEGVWICESAELVGNTPTKINEIKAFLSRQEDGPYRAAYGMESTVRPRQFIPIATNNDPLFLNSLHGNRRFWPVRVWRCDHERVATDRDQLWAEASKCEKAEGSISLPKGLWEEAGKQQEDYRATDPWEDTLNNLPSEISANDLYARLNIPIDRRTPKDGQRLSGIMLKKGYKRERKQENRERLTVYRLLTPFDEETFDYSPENAPDPEVDVDEEEIEHDLEQQYIDRIAKIEADLD